MGIARDGHIGASIRERRHAIGLTQRQLALAAGLSVTVLRDLEQGITSNPRMRTMSKLAEVLDVDAHAAGSSPRPAATGAPAAAPSGCIRMRVLGPLAAWRDNVAVPLGPPRHRTVLAILALSPGRLIHRDTISDIIWHHDPPATASTMIQTAVSHLRRALTSANSRSVLLTNGTRYQLTPAPWWQLDLIAYSQLAQAATAARRRGDSPAAWSLYDQALALWSDDPVADIDVLQTSSLLAGLRAQHASLIADYAEDASAHGNHGRVLPHLYALTLLDPFDERAHACLMIALAGTGNQAAALAAYDRIRERLDLRLGLAPGVGLRTAQIRVLQGDYQPAVSDSLASCRETR